MMVILRKALFCSHLLSSSWGSPLERKIWFPAEIKNLILGWTNIVSISMPHFARLDFLSFNCVQLCTCQLEYLAPGHKFQLTWPEYELTVSVRSSRVSFQSLWYHVGEIFGISSCSVVGCLFYSKTSYYIVMWISFSSSYNACSFIFVYTIVCICRILKKKKNNYMTIPKGEYLISVLILIFYP